MLVCLFLVSQPIETYKKANHKEDKQEQSDENRSQNEQVQLSEAVPSSGSQINLGFHSFLLEELIQSDDAEDHDSVLERVTFSFQKALKVLFRRIISPNAP